MIASSRNYSLYSYFLGVLTNIGNCLGIGRDVSRQSMVNYLAQKYKSIFVTLEAHVITLFSKIL